MQQTCLSPLTSSLVQTGTISLIVNNLLRQGKKAQDTLLTLTDVIALDFPTCSIGFLNSLDASSMDIF